MGGCTDCEVAGSGNPQEPMKERVGGAVVLGACLRSSSERREG